MLQHETFTHKTDHQTEEVTARVEQFGMKLAHQFPWSPAAKVAVGLALRRRFLSDPDAPSKLNRRKQIMEVWAPGLALPYPPRACCSNGLVHSHLLCIHAILDWVLHVRSSMPLPKKWSCSMQRSQLPGG